jgi:hypothetical protein
MYFKAITMLSTRLDQMWITYGGLSYEIDNI